MTDLSRLTFEEVASLAPKHDPETCAREGCGRCRPKGKSNAPALKVNPHDTDRPRPAPIGVEPKAMASSIESTVKAVTAAMQTASALPPRLQRFGPLTWRRVLEWEELSFPVSSLLEDEDEELRRREAIAESIRERMIDQAAAARYAGQLRDITASIAHRQRTLERDARALAVDLGVLDGLISKCNPDAPARIGSKDMLAAQVAADGWCVSCWRDDQFLREITARTTGERYYRDRCRPCGDWRKEHDQDPPIDVLRQMHRRQR